MQPSNFGRNICYIYDIGYSWFVTPNAACGNFRDSPSYNYLHNSGSFLKSWYLLNLLSRGTRIRAYASLYKTVFTRASQYTLSWASRIQSTPSHLVFNIIWNIPPHLTHAEDQVGQSVAMLRAGRLVLDFREGHRVQTGSGTHPALYGLGTVGPHPGTRPKAAGRDYDLSPPSNAEFKNMWSFISVQPYPFVEWCLSIRSTTLFTSHLRLALPSGLLSWQFLI
jgi:hypothetical protein